MRLTQPKTFASVTEAATVVAAPRMLGEYLTERQLSVELGVSVRTVIRWRRQQEAPLHTRIGRRVFYHFKDIESWLQQRRKESR